MERRNRQIQEPFQMQSPRPVFALWRAPVFPPAASEDGTKVVQGHNKGEHLAQSSKSLVHPLHQALLSAQATIKKLTCENITLREENERLTLKELSTLEALEELTSLYSQAKKEKEEEMEARINEMEDFQKEKQTWKDLSRQQLEEINSLRMELLLAQSHNHHIEEEVIETKRELCEGRRQVEKEITSLEKCFCIQRQENAVRVSAMEDHWREVIKVREEHAAKKLRESGEKWQRRVRQLEEELKDTKGITSGVINQLMTITGEYRDALALLNVNQSELCQSRNNCESKCNALEESYRKELTEKENSWRRRVQEMERKNEMLLQKEEESRCRTSALEEEIRLIRQNTQALICGKKKRKKWWKRRLHLRRLMQRNTASTSEETPLMP